MFDVNADTREILLYDVIGKDGWFDEVSADDVQSALKELGGDDVTLRVSSPGGDVWEALRIHNAIADHGKVDIVVDALAASAASYIAMAGRSVRMAENALMMVHAPWTIAAGNAKDFRETAEMLDKHGDAMALAYARKTGMTKDDVLSLFADGELWMTAKEALDSKFVDEVLGPVKVAAKLNNSYFHFSNCPNQIAARVPRFQVEVERPEPPKQEQVKAPRRQAALAKIAALAKNA